MKKIINEDTSKAVDEMLSGMLAAYGRYYERIGNCNAYRYKNFRREKVTLVIGGGSGHEPLFGGFVGKGLADAVACGNVFASPNPNLIFETAKSVNQGKGILFLYGNYEGDNLNFDTAGELCEFENIQTATVRVWDDCTSAPKERETDRRGIAGNVFIIKTAGAACDEGLPLKEVVRIAEKARDNVRSAGLAVSSGSLPGNEKPTFELGEDEIEFGVGIHGEPGVERSKMQPAHALVEKMYEQLKKELQLTKKDEVAVLVNGLGATPLFELNIVYHELNKLLKEDGVAVYDAEVKTYCTSMEMGGFSISIYKLDEELKKYYSAECFSPFYARGVID